MAEIQEHMQVANEVSEAISSPMNGVGLDLDDVRLSVCLFITPCVVLKPRSLCRLS